MSLYIVDIHGELEGDYEEICKYEPCGDAISRQAVIDSIRNYFHDEYYQRTSIQDCRDCLIEDVIKSLPPVTPVRPKGESEDKE